MVEKEKIEQGVINMLKVNMGIKSSEKLLVITDIPTPEEWIKKESREVSEMIERSLLTKMVSEISEESFPDCNVEFYPYPSAGKSGTEPGKEVEEKMKKADAVVAITSYSLSHTKARENASKSGTRIASMPTFLSEMFYPGGPMATDYTKIHGEGEKIAKLINKANEAEITSPEGTNLKFSLKGRYGNIDDGILKEKGTFGNLPAGEVYTVPLEGTTEGSLVVKEGWFADLTENMTFIFKEGKMTEIIGGSKVGDRFREMLEVGKNEEPYISRRNCAELGIGTNPNARRPDNVLEAEKIKGTVHIAIGDSSHMGGKVTSDLHQDFVVSKPTMKFDGKVVMKEGKLIV
ncbi:MAG: aminopeptidase [Candidatus Aerophobetes bacterium]|nr:aminopeptidase [Candidatus Aerophobetes bacterium]